MSRKVFSPKRSEPIIVGWSGQKVIREISARSRVSTTWRAVRIYRTAFVEDHDVIQTIAANRICPIARATVRVLTREHGAVMTSGNH
jgi:hypothetical protein